MTTSPKGAAGFESRDLAARLQSMLEEAGFRPVDPPVLQPADVFLDRSGEDIRRRMYVFTDPGGAELCLRPDLTIPTCRQYLEENPKADVPAKLCYRGLAFRYQSRSPWPMREFTQVGVERIGGEIGEAEDAATLALASRAVAMAGLEDYTLEMGDLALFGALVDALDIPETWAERLKRHFWRPDYFRELLSRLGDKEALLAAGPDLPGLFSALGALDGTQAKALIEEVLTLAGISPVGGRSTREIAERLLEQAADAGAEALPKEVVALIDAFLGIADAPETAMTKIRDLTKGAGLSLGEAMTRLERRFEKLDAEKVDLSKARFATGFGRNMEYYTGFVFEFRTALGGGTVNIAGGGRYDTLLEMLGAPRPVPAVGCAIAVERLAAAAKGESKR
ncbi:ATP phosphoribosyltransferase regulatory subunit [Tepidicaulis sp. LMO-SS28]|uniref:ATP phosphoribosyltransferase regulatory subunit n=1 Tax=Tepidicaulis sp. LMO-SS28 TaxID=3447455 RepID=UPI003EE2DBE8